MKTETTFTTCYRGAKVVGRWAIWWWERRSLFALEAVSQHLEHCIFLWVWEEKGAV